MSAAHCVCFRSVRLSCRTPPPSKHGKHKKNIYNICTTSAQRLRRWSNIVHMLYKCFVFTMFTGLHTVRYKERDDTRLIDWLGSIHFKICTITFRTLRDNQPAYLADLLVRPKCSKYLRSTNSNLGQELSLYLVQPYETPCLCQYVMPKQF